MTEQERALPPEKRAGMFGALANEGRTVSAETKQTRTVFVSVPVKLEVEDVSAFLGPAKAPRPYKARAVGFPEVVAYGSSQEGALVECEQLLKEGLAATFKGSA